MTYERNNNQNMFGNMPTLNAMSSSQYELTIASQPQPQPQDAYSLQTDLDLFTNTQFFDFDMGEVSDNSPTFGIESENGSQAKLPGGIGEFVGNEFGMPGYHVFPSLDANKNHSAIQQSPFAVNNSSSNTAISSPTSTSSTSVPRNDGKRKLELLADSKNSALSIEEASRIAAEEDKRRRNTAASARFRVKKKQREQALEKTAKDMTEKVQYLESRVSQLEMENKLLKDLITEKSGKEVDLSELNSDAKGSEKPGTGVKEELKEEAKDRKK